MNPSLPEDAAARLDRGIVCMNRGYALLGTGSTATLAGSIKAYDEAIELLTPLSSAAQPSIRNSLGAAWMNRGLALHRQGTVESIGKSIRSHGQAVEILRTLPLDEAPWFRRNLAAASMNLANTFLDSEEPLPLREARNSALESIAVSVPLENSDRETAEVGLKARRTLCDAIGRLLLAPGDAAMTADALASEASDAVDEGLALARRWEQKGGLAFRPLAVRLFYFGAQLYRIHQPHFLAEFLSENLRASHTPLEEFRAIALSQIREARVALEGPQLLVDGDPASSRRLQTWRDLCALARLLNTRSNDGVL